MVGERQLSPPFMNNSIQIAWWLQQSAEGTFSNHQHWSRAAVRGAAYEGGEKWAIWLIRRMGKKRNIHRQSQGHDLFAMQRSVWISASFNNNSLWKILNGGCEVVHPFPPLSLSSARFSSSLQNCILCLSELGDHFLSYMPCWLLEFLAPRKLEGKKKSNIYRMPRLISWNGGIWSERK